MPGAFYEAIGAVKNAQFFDDTACMVFSDTMLMTHDKYRQFTTKNIADARTTMIADRDADPGGGALGYRSLIFLDAAGDDF